MLHLTNSNQPTNPLPPGIGIFFGGSLTRLENLGQRTLTTSYAKFRKIISRILCKPKVYLRIDKCRPVSLSWARLIQSIPQNHFLMIHLNIIFLSAPGSCKWFLSTRIPHQNPLHTYQLPFFLHTSPISFFSIWSPEKYLLRSTDN